MNHAHRVRRPIRIRVVTRVALTASMLLALAIPVAAQLSAAGITGQATDETGMALPGVQVDVRDNQGREWTDTTDAGGYFHIAGISPGTYTVKGSLEGFSTVEKRGVTVSVGQAALVNLVFTARDIIEAITVTSRGDDDEAPRLTIVEVFYGTDRLRVSSKNLGETVRGLRAKKVYRADRGRLGLELGKCEVSIPIVHERGSGELESPFMDLAFLDDPTKHFVLQSVTPLAKDRFLDELRAKIRESSSSSALVFIHGFANTFEDAARRTAQIAFDLGFDGAPLMYSWPSRGKRTLTAYKADEASIDYTRPRLNQFLQLVATKSGADRVHVIAHSMGNRAFTDVLKELTVSIAAPILEQIVLVAPDIDADVFKEQIAPRIPAAGTRVTLYSSSRDKALLLSKKAHGEPRAGDASYCMAVPSIDTIDVSDVDTDFLNHFVPASNSSVISDLSVLLAGVTPENRPRLKPKECEGRRYWRFEGSGSQSPR